LTRETYVVHVTKECNCDCKYCYEQDKTSIYTWDEIESVLNDIAKYRTSDSFTIEFLGGEPMTKWDYIVNTVDYFHKLKTVEIPNLDVSFCITTNGTIVNKEIIDLINTSEFHIEFAISMDGTKIANMFRRFKNDKSNTYDKVMENIKILKENGIEPIIHITSHPYNIGYLSDSIIHLYKNGINFIDVGTVEGVITIDEEYCKTFIKELHIISDMIHQGYLPNLRIGLFEWLKPYSDIRTYIKDETGKVVAETYGRSGDDISSQTDEYNIIKCNPDDSNISKLIYSIRKNVYDYHNRIQNN
jgi:sulfatase maturation enzyme AslB (radical SAM superfamily)